MSAQILEKNGKPAFAVLPYEEYKALLEVAEDADDVAALVRFAKRYARGEEEIVPAEILDRLLAGEAPLRVWREHRGMSAAEVAKAVGVTPAHISKLETGRGDPSVAVLAKLSKVLEVSLEELIDLES